MLQRLQLPRILRRFHNVPFHEDLTPLDDDLFNLADFKHYKESPEVRAHRERLGLAEEQPDPQKQPETHKSVKLQSSLEEAAARESPVVFTSRLNNPYLNLAIEDYVFQNMPLPAEGTSNFNRLMFYVNSPCVVVGKNQNPWAETNMPLLNSLRLPLVRRRSGGGTVVHDMGNVNYSFMTSKANFDRHKFANIVCDAVNDVAPEEKHIKVTERGDIVTKLDLLKVSGSAYKLTKGRFYHHGTMLLNSKLSVLKQLLRRDETKTGKIESSTAVQSVKSPVTNLHLDENEFIKSLTRQFEQNYGETVQKSEDEDLLGVQGFIDAFSDKSCAEFVIDESTELPEQVQKMKDELLLWEWRFGNTMKFDHVISGHESGAHVTFHVKKGLLHSFSLHEPTEAVVEAFQFLQLALQREPIRYEGSTVCGYITDDKISDWIGTTIDGTT